MVKLCIVHGCNEPRFRKCTRCHAHQQEVWREDKKKQLAKNPQYKASQHVSTNKAKGVRLMLERGICVVDGCGKHCAKHSTYCMAHRKQLEVTTIKRKYNTNVKTVQVVENLPILADLPRLIVINTNETEYIEYAPIKRIKATSKASLKVTKGILTSRKGWIVMGGEDNG